MRPVHKKLIHNNVLCLSIERLSQDAFTLEELIENVNVLNIRESVMRVNNVWETADRSKHSYCVLSCSTIRKQQGSSSQLLLKI